MSGQSNDAAGEAISRESSSPRWLVDAPIVDSWREARLVIVRHGESWWNAEGRIQGQGGTGLSDRGRAQAVEIAEYLLATYPEPAKVFCSDLERVTRTAEPYLSRSGRPAEADKRLREIDTGAWTGLLTAEVAERFPEQIEAIRRNEDIARGGGETFAAMRVRVGEALRDVARATVSDAPAGRQATAIVFTHGGPIRVAVAEALRLPPGGHRLLDPLENCSVTVLSAVVAPSGEVAPIRLTSYNAVYATSGELSTLPQPSIGG